MGEDQNVDLARSAGILLHPTSLPSRKLDREAYRFVDWLAAAGQSWWQVLPLGPPDEGADHAGWPELFAPGEVAGAPPDALSAHGQRWGNPLYDWPAHRATGYRWWRERFRRTFELVDVCRVDHFRGFVSYWAIPERNRTAKNGRWRPGPGAEPFHAVAEDLGHLSLIAEDLGHITPPVYRLRDELGLPGTVVLLWAFRPSRRNPHAPANHRVNSVAYTSTHDTATAVGWFRSLTPKQRLATGLDPHEPHWGLIEIAWYRPLTALWRLWASMLVLLGRRPGWGRIPRGAAFEASETPRAPAPLPR